MDTNWVQVQHLGPEARQLCFKRMVGGESACSMAAGSGAMGAGRADLPCR